MSEHEQILEKKLRLGTVSVGISLCWRKIYAWARFSKEIKDIGSAPVLKKNQQGTLKVRIWVANTGCVRYLNQAWPPGLLLSYIITLHSAEQGLARCAKTPGARPSLEEILGLAPSHPHAPQSSQGLELRGPPWGLIHAIPTVLIHNLTILRPGKIHALSK